MLGLDRRPLCRQGEDQRMGFDPCRASQRCAPLNGSTPPSRTRAISDTGPSRKSTGVLATLTSTSDGIMPCEPRWRDDQARQRFRRTIPPISTKARLTVATRSNVIGRSASPAPLPVEVLAASARRRQPTHAIAENIGSRNKRLLRRRARRGRASRCSIT